MRLVTGPVNFAMMRAAKRDVELVAPCVRGHAAARTGDGEVGRLAPQIKHGRGHVLTDLKNGILLENWRLSLEKVIEATCQMASVHFSSELFAGMARRTCIDFS
jgi:hypothetical protein